MGPGDPRTSRQPCRRSSTELAQKHRPALRNCKRKFVGRGRARRSQGARRPMRCRAQRIPSWVTDQPECEPRGRPLTGRNHALACRQHNDGPEPGKKRPRLVGRGEMRVGEFGKSATSAQVAARVDGASFPPAAAGQLAPPCLEPAAGGFVGLKQPPARPLSCRAQTSRLVLPQGASLVLTGG